MHLALRFPRLVRQQTTSANNNLILMRLPPLPPMEEPADPQLCDQYFRGVHSLLRELPPTLLVETGAGAIITFSPEI